MAAVDFSTFDHALEDLDTAANTMAFVGEILGSAESVDLSREAQTGLYHMIRAWQAAARNASDTSWEYFRHMKSGPSASADVMEQAQNGTDGKRATPDRNGQKPIPVLTEPMEASDSLTSAAQG